MLQSPLSERICACCRFDLCAEDSARYSPIGKYGQDWIRTSEGVKPADYSLPRLATSVPTLLARGISYILALHSLQLALAFAAVDSTNVTDTF